MFKENNSSLLKQRNGSLDIYFHLIVMHRLLPFSDYCY